MVALSVSTSAISSPALTRSPSFLYHFTTVPSVIVSESWGMVISAGIRLLLRWLGPADSRGLGCRGNGAVYSWHVNHGSNRAHRRRGGRHGRRRTPQVRSRHDRLDCRRPG